MEYPQLQLHSFSKLGAISTFGAYFAAGGKNEILQLLQTAIEGKTMIVHDARIELYGRLVACTMLSLLSTLSGGFIVGTLRSDMGANTPSTDMSRYLLIGWIATVFGVLCLLNGKIPHTTQFTRLCVHAVDRVIG